MGRVRRRGGDGERETEEKGGGRGLTSYLKIKALYKMRHTHLHSATVSLRIVLSDGLA